MVISNDAIRLRLQSRSRVRTVGAEGPAWRKSRKYGGDDLGARPSGPPGFTISTSACRMCLEEGMTDELVAEIASARDLLEQDIGKSLGASDDPLLVSVHSGAKFSMPGMMDTVLNLGLNDRSAQRRAEQTNNVRFTFHSYRRFISMYARIILDVDGALFEEVCEEAKVASGATSDSSISSSALSKFVERS